MNKKRRIRALSWMLAMLLLIQDGAMAYAANIAGTEPIVVMEETEDDDTYEVSGNDVVTEEEKIIGEETGEMQKEDSTSAVSENSVSENDVSATTSGEEELDYILGREMTPEEIAAQQAMVPELVPLEPMELEAEDVYAGLPVNFLTDMESSYDSRDLNIVTSVKNQGRWGACWAFSTLSIMESSLLKQKPEVWNGIDLSERHLAYFCANTGYDVLGNASLDTITPPNEVFYLENGGNVSRATMRLMNWQGAALESEYPYSTQELAEVIARENAQNIVATVKDVYFIPTKGASVKDEKTVIKKLIKEFGSVSWSYYADNNYENLGYNNSTGAYYCSDSTKGTNHAITLVGWDDNYSKFNFNTNNQPQNDGAWIVKNSWGPYWGDSGYFYISYEDATLGQGNAASVAIAGQAGEYHNNYFYSNCCTSGSSNKQKAAQVFEAKSGAEQEILGAVSFMLASDKEEYEIQVYKNPDMVEGIVTNPESGEPMYTKPYAGETGYAGLYTIDIPDVTLQSGDLFAVVVTFTDTDGGAYIYYDSSAEGQGTARTMVNATEPGQSFWFRNGSWVDLHSEGESVRMNAFTTNVYGSVPSLYCKQEKPLDFTGVQKNRVIWTECLNAEKYQIYRSDSLNGIYNLIGEVERGTLSYEDSLSVEQWNTTYYYKVKVIYSDGTTAESKTLEVPGKVILEVSGLTADTISDYNELAWQLVEGADGYEIERKLSSELEFKPLVTITNGKTVTYKDSLNGSGNVYEYRIRAYKGKLYSKWSATVSADNVFAELYNYGTKEQKISLSWGRIPTASQYIVKFYRWGYVWTYPAIDNNYMTVPTSHFKLDANTGIGDEITFEVIPLDAQGNEITNYSYQKVKLVWTPMEVLSVSHVYASGTANFTWTGAANADFIDIYRSTNKNGHGENIFKTIDASETSFTDSGLERGDVYYYWLYTGATNSDGKKVYSKAYCYKLEVPSNAESIELELSAETVTKGKEVTAMVSEYVSGEKFEYKKNVTWSAKNGTKMLDIVEEDSVTKVIGSDGKEILRINDRTITATGLSMDKSVTLIAQVGNHTDEAQITVKVMLDGLQINVLRVNEEESDTLPAQLYLYDRILIEPEYSPENADVEKVTWSYDDTMVQLTNAGLENHENAVYVDIIKAGKTPIIAIAKAKGEKYSVQSCVYVNSILKTVAIDEVEALEARKLRITWSKVYGDESYHIYRRVKGEEEYSLIKENVTQNTYIDDTVEIGINYEYKIQLIKDGIESSLEDTKSKSGSTVPDEAEVVEKTYRSLSIKNDTACEYAISKVDNRENANYVYDHTGEDIVFENLEPEQTYYVFVRLIDNPQIYGETLQVTLPEKGKLLLSPDNLILTKGESRTITYTVTTGETEQENLNWSASYLDGSVCETEKADDGSFVFKGKDGKEICKITGNTILATGLSEAKELSLNAKNGNDKEGSLTLKIKVPVESIEIKNIIINEETATEFTLLNLNDTVSLTVETGPLNADDDTLTWTSSAPQVLKVVEATENGTTVSLKAMEKGSSTLTATTEQGKEVAWNVYVINQNEIYEYRIVDETEELTVADVVKEIDENGHYVLAEFARGCDLSVDGADGKATQQSLKVYGLKNHTNQSTENPIERLYKLEVLEPANMVFVSTNPAVANVTEEGVVLAVGQGEADIYAYGTTSKEKYGKYHVTVTGKAEVTEEECSIDKSVKLSAVTSKVYLEQFGHQSNHTAELAIKGTRDYVYNVEDFFFTSADTNVCLVDENGIVSVNPSYSGTKDKTVKVTASVKNDPAKRKVTFSVVVYGKQQMAQLEIVHAEDTPNTVAVEYGKNKTITLGVLAWGSNGDPMTAPSAKWSVSNSAVATVKANKDGTATVTMKKPGQCSIICTANDSLKNSDSLLLKAIDITPILDKTTVKLQTKTASVEGWKVSESFRITSVYGAEYEDMKITSVKLGKTDLYSSDNYVLMHNNDGSYSLAVKDSAIGSLKHNNKLTVGIAAAVKDTDEDVAILETSFNMTMQIVTTEPSVTVKEAGTINRYYQSGENVRSLLTIKTNETIKDVRLDGEGQINDFNSSFMIKKNENGQWYLVLTDTGLTTNSVKGKLFIILEGYETITKTITVKTPSKKPAFSQQSVPVININDSNQQADVVMLKNKKPAEYLYVESAGENAKADIEAIDGGMITMKLIKEPEQYKHNETVSVTARVWETETNEAGSFIYNDPVLVTLKVKISTQTPKVTAKTKTLALNRQADGEKAVTVITCNQHNVEWYDVDEWKVSEYNSISKQYDITDIDWLTAEYDETSGNVSLQLTPSEAKTAGTYKIRLTNMLDGFEAVPLDLTVKVIDTAPTVTVKTSGKLDLTNLSACSLVGTLSFKNTVSTKIDADSLKVIDDDRFAASLTGEGKVALTVTDEGKIEGNVAATKINVKLGFTLEGGTEIETVMQIKPVVTIPKLTIPAAKKLYKSIPYHTVSYNLGELLAEGAAISKIELVSSPNQFEVDEEELNNGIVCISLKENEKGLKAGKYSFKVKVTFVGAPDKPQTKTIQVQLVE